MGHILQLAVLNYQRVGTSPSCAMVIDSLRIYFSQSFTPEGTQYPYFFSPTFATKIWRFPKIINHPFWGSPHLLMTYPIWPKINSWVSLPFRQDAVALIIRKAAPQFTQQVRSKSHPTWWRTSWLTTFLESRVYIYNIHCIYIVCMAWTNFINGYKRLSKIIHEWDRLGIAILI